MNAPFLLLWGPDLTYLTSCAHSGRGGGGFGLLSLAPGPSGAASRPQMSLRHGVRLCRLSDLAWRCRRTPLEALKREGNERRGSVAQKEAVCFQMEPFVLRASSTCNLISFVDFTSRVGCERRRRRRQTLVCLDGFSVFVGKGLPSSVFQRLTSAGGL